MAKALSLMTFVSLARSTDPAVKPAFTALGAIEDIEVTPRPQYVIHSAPTTLGRRRQYAVPIGAELDFQFTLKELSGAAWEMIWLTAALSMTGDQSFDPLGGTGPWQGFVRIEQRSGEGTLRNSVDIYAVLTVDPVRMGPDQVMVTIKGEALESTLNTGALTDLE